MEAMMKNFDDNDCKKMMKEMPSETREKCRKMMTTCLKTLQEMEKRTEQ
jgi:ribonucleotide reductase beta subunit family protein with ferritin-like domain